MPPDVNPIAVDKCIIKYHIQNYRFLSAAVAQPRLWFIPLLMKQTQSS